MAYLSYPVSGHICKTTTFCGLTTTTLVPVMPKGSRLMPDGKNWLLPDGQIVLPVINNRAEMRAMMNGK